MIRNEKAQRQLYEFLCRMDQSQIIEIMANFLKKNGYSTVINNKSFLIGIGDIPIGLCAHADTVFNKPPINFFYDSEKKVIWSPEGMGADDKAGIFSIMNIVASLEKKPHVIITTDEELGCVGASKCIKKFPVFPGDLNFLIQLDRQGIQDCVFYDCINESFTSFIEKFGFTTAIGSFSDISILAPSWGVAGVNLSVGYFNEHQKIEYLRVDALFNTIQKVLNIFKYLSENPKENIKYEYISNGNDLYKYLMLDNSDVCDICLKEFKESDLVEIYYENDSNKYNLCCADCLKKLGSHVKVCQKCGTTWFSEKSDTTPLISCEICQKKKE